MKDRLRSRELALKVLYQMEHNGEDPERAIRDFIANFPAPEKPMVYASQLVRGIADKRQEIDQALSSVSRRWRLERMAQVDRNILRLACFEMLFSQGEVPPRVAISQAVELAKRYGGDDSPAFINAVLDTLLSSQATDEQAEPGEQEPPGD
jgi:N utilization substance protein B